MINSVSKAQRRRPTPRRATLTNATVSLVRVQGGAKSSYATPRTAFQLNGSCSRGAGLRVASQPRAQRRNSTQRETIDGFLRSATPSQVTLRKVQHRNGYYLHGNARRSMAVPSYVPHRIATDIF